MSAPRVVSLKRLMLSIFPPPPLPSPAPPLVCFFFNEDRARYVNAKASLPLLRFCF